MQFWEEFKLHREINRIYYQLVPEEQYDYRMVDTLTRKSDSPRESLNHHIGITRDYIEGINTGLIQFNLQYEDLREKTLSKEVLLNKFQETETTILQLLFEKDMTKIYIKAPWRPEKSPAIEVLWGLNSHEIFHTGWNVAVMDHLDIPRFPELKAIWG